MAIFGQNFNRTDIPDNLIGHFPARILINKHTPRITGKHWTDAAMRDRCRTAILVGVATTLDDARTMIDTVHNGSRTIFVIDRKINLGRVTVWGIYIW